MSTLLLMRMVIMSILDKNIEKFKVNLSTLDHTIVNLLNDNDEKLINEPNFESNRTLFLVYELKSTKEIMRLINGLNEKSIAFIYYRDERYLYELLSKIDFSEKDEKVIFFAGDYKEKTKIEELDQLLSTILYSYSNIQPIIKESLDLDYIRSAKEFLEFVRNYRDNYNFLLGNDLNDTLYGVRNRLKNLSRYAVNPGLKEFVEKYGHVYKNKPAVVVASGPSLDKNVHHLKKYEDKALILSCDGSVSTLKRYGITPDIMGSVERVYRTYEVFYKDKDIDENIVFTAPALVRPEMVQKFDGKKILSVFKDREVYGKWMNELTLNKKGTIYSGTSVAHFMLNLADALGCNPIILIGQDLAYSLEGVSHAGDTEIKETIDISKVTEWVKDYNGNYIPSTSVWKKFLLTFEDLIRNMDKTVIDATEGGALIKGTEIKPLLSVLEEYCIESLPSFKELLDQISIESDYIEAAKQNSYNGINEAIVLFADFLEHVSTAIVDNKKCLDRMEKGIKTQKQLDKIYDCLEFVDNELVKYIAVTPMFGILFQYPIYSAARQINTLQTDKFTLESLYFNLDLHRELLDIFEKNLKKMIKVLITGLEDNKDFFQGIDGYSSAVQELKSSHNYLFKNSDFDIYLV